MKTWESVKVRKSRMDDEIEQRFEERGEREKEVTKNEGEVGEREGEGDKVLVCWGMVMKKKKERRG